MNHPLCPPVKEHFYSSCISHISAKTKQNMKWYKMIYGTGSLERRPSSWKSNKHLLPMCWTRRWYVQEALSQDDHVLNRLPPIKYSWPEIYSLIFHYLLPLLCIHQELSTSAARSHFHHPPWRSAMANGAVLKTLFLLPTRGRRLTCSLFRHSVVTWSSFFSSRQWQTETEGFWGFCFFLFLDAGGLAVEVFGWLHVTELTEA